MRMELDVPILEKHVLWAAHSRDVGIEIDFNNKHGQIQRGRVMGVEFKIPPQGVGRGYFMDVMIGGDEHCVSEYLAQKLLDKQADQ